MNETIEKLIASGKEGPWWDFKQTKWIQQRHRGFRVHQDPLPFAARDNQLVY
nr:MULTISPECIES: hypothetical protein [Citrobacter freundii complex]